MVFINVGAVPAYCIDSTEVTHAQYAEFLAVPSKPVGPVECVGNVEFDPAAQGFNGCPFKVPVNPPINFEPTWPVSCVDWCDAWSYCAWAGKRLCGKFGGGANDFDAADDATRSQWFHACSEAGKYAFPYSDVSWGDHYWPEACHTEVGSYDAQFPAPVASFPKCEGGYPGIFDMSGNVSEWVDECEGEFCRTRGGSFINFGDQASCSDNGAGSYALGRVTPRRETGFRCCL